MRRTRRISRAACTLLVWCVLGCALDRAAAAQNSGTGNGNNPGSNEGDATSSPTENRNDVGSPNLLSIQPGPIDPAVYRLGPGDGLSLEMSGRLVRQLAIPVDVEGLANFPEIGVVRVGRRTLNDVRALVLPKIRVAYPGVRVDLRLVRLRGFKVYVAGMVKSPGVASANGAARSSEILQGAFALSDGASRRNIELRHTDGSKERVDLDAFAALGRAADNPFVLDGDVLFVPPRKERMFALGAFGRPGEFERLQGDSIAALLELAGGLLPGSEPRSAVLYRFVTATTIDSLPIDLTDRATLERSLENGDRVFVRQNSDFRQTRNVTIVGEAVYPGPFAIQEGVDRVADVLARAGGVTPFAARGRIQVFRPLTTTSSRRDIEFERLSRLSRSEMTDAEYQTFRTKLAAHEATYVLSYEDLVHADGSHNVLLKDGDILLVDRESQAVRVDGQVLRPSLIEFARGRTVDEYIQLAGGFGRRAWHGKIRVTRAGSNQTLYARDVRAIEPGDFIWVPEKNDVKFWGVFKDVITVAGAAATVILVVRGK